MKAEHESTRVTEARSDTPSLYNGEGDLQLGQIHQVIHSNSLQNPTDINPDAEMLASPSGEDNGVPSQSSRLIPEYANLCI